MPPHDTLRAFLLSKVEIVGTCWLWTGGLDHSGYGRFHADGTTHSAHRWSYIVHKGDIPPGNLACHNCPGGDNRRCINPDHLFVGTHKDNMQDAKAKGRIATGERSGMRLHPESIAQGDKRGHRTHPERIRRGERHGLAKLTENDVREIRRLYAAGGQSYARLAARFGVQDAAVRRILVGETWAWLD